MRLAFAKTLVELAESDRRIILLTGDLGFMVLEEFAERYPARFFNIGVAEQNMVGLATGLAEAGYLPFLYSIGTFASMRAYEHVRNGPVLHHLPVRIVGVGGGFEYGHGGPTHWALEDVGVMRVQPGLTLIAPADHEQARAALLATYDLPGPIYYRLGKRDDYTIPGLDGRFRLGRVEVIREGAHLLLISMGSIATEVVAAADGLATKGIETTVVIIASLNPAPAEDLANLLARFPLAMTVESHYIVGGVGSLVAEVIAEKGLRCRLVRCGVKESLGGVSGSEAYMRRANGLACEALISRAFQELDEMHP